MARARTRIPATASSSSASTRRRCLNKQYTVWGTVIEGMENIDAINKGEPPQQARYDRLDAGRRRRGVVMWAGPQPSPPRKWGVNAPSPSPLSGSASGTAHTRRLDCHRMHARRGIRFRAAGGADRAPAGRAARCGAAAGRAAGQALEDRARARSARSCCGRATCWCSTTPRSSRRSLQGARMRDGAAAPVAVDADRADRRASWWAFAKPGRRLAAGDRIRFGHEGRVCLLGTLEATVEEKLADGRVRLRFGFHGAYLDEALARDRRHAAAALHRLAAGRRRAGPRRLPDHLCGARRARSPRRPPGCTSRRRCSRGSRRPGSSANS